MNLVAWLKVKHLLLVSAVCIPLLKRALNLLKAILNIITRKHNNKEARSVVLSINPYSMNLSFIAEPILTMGSIECVTWPDNWTTLTADGSPAAQFEHTILITRTGAEILTTC